MVNLASNRSTKTPAMGPSSANGIRKATLISVTCAGVAFKRNDTSLKTANRAKKSPKMLTICAIHNSRTGRSARISPKDNCFVSAVITLNCLSYSCFVRHIVNQKALRNPAILNLQETDGGQKDSTLETKLFSISSNGMF